MTLEDKILNGSNMSPQKELHFELLSIFSDYNAAYGSDKAKNTLIYHICKHFHFTKKYLNKLMIGSNQIKTMIYEDVISYLCSLPSCHRALINSENIIFS